MCPRWAHWWRRRSKKCLAANYDCRAGTFFSDRSARNVVVRARALLPIGGPVAPLQKRRADTPFAGNVATAGTSAEPKKTARKVPTAASPAATWVLLFFGRASSGDVGTSRKVSTPSVSRQRGHIGKCRSGSSESAPGRAIDLWTGWKSALLVNITAPWTPFLRLFGPNACSASGGTFCITQTVGTLDAFV